MPKKAKIDTTMLITFKGCTLSQSEQKVLMKRVEQALKHPGDVEGQMSPFEMSPLVTVVTDPPPP